MTLKHLPLDGLNRLDRRKQAITLAGDRLDKSRSLGVIAQRFPQALYRGVHAVFELHHGTVRPKVLLDLRARDEPVRLLQ